MTSRNNTNGIPAVVVDDLRKEFFRNDRREGLRRRGVNVDLALRVGGVDVELPVLGLDLVGDVHHRVPVRRLADVRERDAAVGPEMGEVLVPELVLQGQRRGRDGGRAGAHSDAQPANKTI